MKRRVIAAFLVAFIMLGNFTPHAHALPSVIETNQYYRDTVLKNKTDRFESLLDVYKSNNQGAMVLHTYMDYLVAIMGNPYYSEDNVAELDEKVIDVLSDMYKSLSASNLSFTSSLEHYVDAIQQRVDELQAAYDSLGFWAKVGQFFVSLGRWCCGLGWTSNNEERELKTSLEYYTILVGIVFALIRYASSTKDDAMDNLTAAVGQMDQLKFNGYDNVTVKGAAVSSALYEFDSQPTAIIVKTKATTNPTTNYLAELTSIPASIESSGDLKGFYKADFKLDATTGSFSGYRRDFSVTKDNKLTSTYIKPTANFKATLIKDANGTTIGIFFEQTST